MSLQLEIGASLLQSRVTPFPAYFANTAYDLVVVAASAGGIPALRDVLARLPASFPAPIAIVQHLAPLYRSQLAGLLQFRSRLAVKFADHGDRLRAGTACFAPPDRHLAVTPERRLALGESERVNFTRPAADPLFQSASEVFGDRVLAVVLTGTGRDGAEGALSVHRRGGTVLVQDPKTAVASGMPEAAIKAGAADIVLPIESISQALVALTMVQGTAELLGLMRPAA